MNLCVHGHDDAKIDIAIAPVTRLDNLDCDAHHNFPTCINRKLDATKREAVSSFCQNSSLPGKPGDMPKECPTLPKPSVTTELARYSRTSEQYNICFGVIRYTFQKPALPYRHCCRRVRLPPPILHRPGNLQTRSYRANPAAIRCKRLPHSHIRHYTPHSGPADVEISPTHSFRRMSPNH